MVILVLNYQNDRYPKSEIIGHELDLFFMIVKYKRFLSDIGYFRPEYLSCRMCLAFRLISPK